MIIVADTLCKDILNNYYDNVVYITTDYTANIEERKLATYAKIVDAKGDLYFDSNYDVARYIYEQGIPSLVVPFK